MPRQLVIQFNDVSGKMLYNEARAMQSFVTMMQASVSHEIRNPLASLTYKLNELRSLIKQSQAMQRKLKNNNMSEQGLSKIKQELIVTNARIDDCARKVFAIAQYIDFFLHDMLDFGVLSEKAENFVRTIETFDLQETLYFMQEIFHEKIELKQISMDIKFKQFDMLRPMVTTDKKRLLQVLINLVSNAIKFTKTNGSIVVTAEVKEENNKPMLKMSIKDTGVGIKDEDKPRLFQLFGSIKDEQNQINTKGIGLGLVISQMIVFHFNGTIDFESTFNEGSTFWFTFELAKDDRLNLLKYTTQELLQPDEEEASSSLEASSDQEDGEDDKEFLMNAQRKVSI